MKRLIMGVSLVLLTVATYANDKNKAEQKPGTSFSCSLNESEVGSRYVKDKKIDYWDRQTNSSYIKIPENDVVYASIINDSEINKNVLKIHYPEPKWVRGLRMNVNSDVTENRTLTVRMKFEYDVLTRISTGQAETGVKKFEVLIHIGGVPEGSSKVIYGDVWSTFQWEPSLVYKDYTESLNNAISVWEKEMGKKLKTISYIQLAFLDIKDVGYIGDYYVESVNYGVEPVR